MPIRCVLFDFDGVIADTEERNADYLASALAHFGVRLTEEDRSALVGINDPSLLEALLKRAETPVTLEQLQAEPASAAWAAGVSLCASRTGHSHRRSLLYPITAHSDRARPPTSGLTVRCGGLWRYGHSAQARSGTLSAGNAASGACPRRLSGHRGFSRRHPCRKSRRLYRAGLYRQFYPSGRLCGRFRPF